MQIGHDLAITHVNIDLKDIVYIIYKTYSNAILFLLKQNSNNNRNNNN